MKRYLVKSVNVATANNHSFGGETHTYLYGKDDYQIKAVGNPYFEKDFLTPSIVRDHGYKRECDAKRSYIFKNPENTEWWRSTSEIVAYEIWGDSAGKLYLKEC